MWRNFKKFQSRHKGRLSLSLFGAQWLRRARERARERERERERERARERERERERERASAGLWNLNMMSKQRPAASNSTSFAQIPNYTSMKVPVNEMKLTNQGAVALTCPNTTGFKAQTCFSFSLYVTCDLYVSRPLSGQDWKGLASCLVTRATMTVWRACDV